MIDKSKLKELALAAQAAGDEGAILASPAAILELLTELDSRIDPSDRVALSNVQISPGIPLSHELMRLRAYDKAAQEELVRAGWFLYQGIVWVATSSDDPRATILYRKAKPESLATTSTEPAAAIDLSDAASDVMPPTRGTDSQRCISPLALHPILYTDTVNGVQVCRDDLWAVTTAQLNEASASPVPRAQGGITNIGKCQICVCGQPDTEGTTHRTDGPCFVTGSSPADAGGLTRWHHNEFTQEVHEDPCGEFVKYSDVCARAASPAAAVAAPAPAFDALGFARKVRELSLDYAAMHFDGVDAKCSSIYVSHYLRALKDAPLDISGIAGEFAAPVAGSQHAPEGWRKAMRDLVRVLRGVECGDDSQWPFIANVCANADDLLAAAAPAVPVPAAEPKVMPSPLYFKALALVHEKGFASVSMVQRRMVIGYNDAENIVQLMLMRGDITEAMTSGHLAAPSLQQPKEGAAS